MRKHRGKILVMAVVTVLLMQVMGMKEDSLNAAFGTSVVVSAATNAKKVSKQVPKLTISSRSATTATMQVSMVTNASYYKIYRSSSLNGKYTYVGKTTTKSFKDTNLSASKSYYYKARAMVNSKNTAYTSPVRLNKTLGKTNNLSAKVKNKSVTLTWSGVSGAMKYKVYRSVKKDSDYSYLGSSTARSYTDKTVKNNKTYYYRVRAMKDTGVVYNGVYSNKVKAKVVSSSLSSGKSSANQSEFMQEVLRLVNVERGKEGLSKLTTTSILGDAANQRAIEIKEVFSHTRPDGSSCFTALDDYKVSYMAAGENIAYGYKTPEAVVTGWMNSEGHRKNIMNNKFGKVGIGCYYSNGTYYWTQLFTN